MGLLTVKTPELSQWLRERLLRALAPIALGRADTAFDIGYEAAKRAILDIVELEANRED